jgi:hypothetical protein
MVETVADGDGNRRFGGSARELGLQPRLQIGNPRLAFRLAHRPPLRRASAADLRLDLVQLGDPPQRLLCDRRRPRLGDLVEAPAPVRPAEGQDHGVAGTTTAGHLLVGGIAVALTAPGAVVAAIDQK